MAKGVDAAAIGMGVKDIVIGIAAAAVGAAGGGQFVGRQVQCVEDRYGRARVGRVAGLQPGR